MERIERICSHPLYVRSQSRIDEKEENRIFCCHSITHSLDVARIMYILVLEQELSFDKEVIYATALLHDLGRGIQYESHVSHHQIGAELADEILRDCGFDEGEIDLITEAIAGHKNGRGHLEQGLPEEVSFQELFYKADKLSRNCFDCKAKEECYWEQEKRNLYIKY